MEDKDKDLRDLINDINGLIKDGNQSELMVKLSILKHYDYDKFMDTMYKVFTTNGSQFVEVNNGNPAEKITALKSMIEYYENKTEYEKCADLYKLQTQLEQPEHE